MNLIRQTRGAARALRVSLPVAAVLVAASSTYAAPLTDAATAYGTKTDTAEGLGALAIPFAAVLGVIGLVVMWVRKAGR
jgi:hypothetical protein